MEKWTECMDKNERQWITYTVYMMIFTAATIHIVLLYICVACNKKNQWKQPENKIVIFFLLSFCNMKNDRTTRLALMYMAIYFNVFQLDFNLYVFWTAVWSTVNLCLYTQIHLNSSITQWHECEMILTTKILLLSLVKTKTYRLYSMHSFR